MVQMVCIITLAVRSHTVFVLVLKVCFIRWKSTIRVVNHLISSTVMLYTFIKVCARCARPE